VHLLQAALRQVLGAHVEQAGSLVEPDCARFDFQHFSAMSDAEIAETERIVNEKILEGIAGVTREMPIDEAKKLGAMALFGEKYGDTVRVVTFGDFSMELCGGTHLDNSAKVGLFKIVSEASVAAGVRRIEAVTGKAVLKLLHSRESEIAETAAALRTTPTDLTRRAAQVSEEVRTQAREIETLSGKLARVDAEKMLTNAEEIGAVKLIALTLNNQNSAGLRTLCDTLRDMDESVVAVLGTVSDGKVAFAAGIGKAAVKAGAHAGNLLKAAAKVCGGGGGGRPDSATAGGRDTEKLAEAIIDVKASLNAMLK
jgi:alanyl-tRNA synthetase